jgi:hypothetical protein
VRELVFVVMEIAFVIAFVAAVFGVAEWIAALQYSRWAYRIGPIVLRETRKLPDPSAESGASSGTAGDEFRLVEPDVVLFRPRSRGLSVFDAFAVKGTMRLAGEDAVIEGRAPISTMIFVDSWSVGWIATTLYMSMTGQGVLKALGLSLLAPLSIVGARFFWVPMEVRRTSKMLDELEAQLGEAGPSDERDEPRVKGSD